MLFSAIMTFGLSGTISRGMPPMKLSARAVDSSQSTIVSEGVAGGTHRRHENVGVVTSVSALGGPA